MINSSDQSLFDDNIANTSFQQANLNSNDRVDSSRSHIGDQASNIPLVNPASVDDVGDSGNPDAPLGNIRGPSTEGNATSYELSSSPSAGSASNALASDDVSTTRASTIQGQQYPTDAHGNFIDPNPQIINRPAPEGVQTHTQNIQVRYLRPRPTPPPGPRIIVEVNQPLPPLPKPLQVRQPAPAAVQKPPIILRERPPPKLPVIPPERITRPVPPPPPPPRSVIIERMAPSPSTPPDIIIERWVPRDPPPVRETKVIAAPPQEPYPPPRNIIILYEPVPVRIIRNFERLDVIKADDEAYIRQYGPHLLDSATLLQKVRDLGIVEDLSPPTKAASVDFNATSYNQLFPSNITDGVATDSVDGEAGIGSGFDAPSSNFSSINH